MKMTPSIFEKSDCLNQFNSISPNLLDSNHTAVAKAFCN